MAYAVGSEMTPQEWEDPQNRCLGMLLDGRTQISGVQRAGADATLLIIVNAGHDNLDFSLPEVAHGSSWLCILDTTDPEKKTSEPMAFKTPYGVTGRSLVLLELQGVQPS